MKNLITKLSTPLPHREGQGVGLLGLLGLLLFTIVACCLTTTSVYAQNAVLEDGIANEEVTLSDSTQVTLSDSTVEHLARRVALRPLYA